MPKYYEYKIAGYYLYFTSYCVIECMHVHASDRKLTEIGSAKFFVKDNGDTLVQNRGILNDREIRKIQEFIKQNYQEMYLKWSEYSQEGFYEKNNLKQLVNTTVQMVLPQLSVLNFPTYRSFASNNCFLQRPYIVRFIIFNRLFVPSTKPLL